MPIYTYRREDGTEFDVVHKMDEKLEVCPDTGQKLTRIINWEGNTMIKGWSPGKELKKEEWKRKNPHGTTLPEYQKTIDENTQKAREEKEKLKPNITEI